jgi:cytochrome c oxidase assembly protein subunit 11
VIAMQTGAPSPAPRPRNNRLVAGAVVGVVAGMGALAYAAVPLYQMFCRATGYGGTTQVSREAPALRGARALTVSLDANVAPGLPWSFSPEVASLSLRTGETATVFFRVRNNSDRAWAATAAYNVSPDQSGAWFNKISCFCFEEQRLAAGESADWPVVFYLDPALEKDATMDRVDSVTLSYTFFASKAQPVVAAAAGAKPGL